MHAPSAAMKRTFPLAAIGLACALVIPLARGGDYHCRSTLNCSECHVMHFSQSHGYAGARLGGSPLFGFGPNPGLLRASANDLCLSCHDGNAYAPDVFGPQNTGNAPGDVRLGGYLSRLGNAGPLDTGHTLDSLEVAPGSQPSWDPQNENGAGRGLLCINCHDPHGDAGAGHPTGSQYRNLRSNLGNSVNRWVTYNDASLGVNQLTRDVFERTVGAYDESDVDWNEPNSNSSAIARWCGSCHTTVHGNWLDGGGGGGNGSGGALREHPVWGENLESSMRTRYNSLVNRVKVMSSVGIWFPAGSDVTPTCTTCHKAHGNGNVRSLIFRSGTGTLSENGDSNGSTQLDLCRQCHYPNPPN